MRRVRAEVADLVGIPFIVVELVARASQRRLQRANAELEDFRRGS